MVTHIMYTKLSISLLELPKKDKQTHLVCVFVVIFDATLKHIRSVTMTLQCNYHKKRNEANDQIIHKKTGSLN